MNQDLESRLRTTLAARAESIVASDLAVRPADGFPHVAMEVMPQSRRRRPLALAVAVVVAVTGIAVTVGSRDRGQPRSVPVTAGSPPATPVASGSAAAAWPLNNDEPLPEPSDADPRSPDLVARAYLTEVLGLPADWPIQDLATQDSTAVVDYILQDVPAQVRLARADNGSWFVTSASTDFLRPELVGTTSVGLDVSIAGGPRASAEGVQVRVTAVAVDGRVLARRDVRTAPTRGDAAAAAIVTSLSWPGVELAAAVRADVMEDIDIDATTPDVVVGHWTAAVIPPQATGTPTDYDVLTAEPVYLGSGRVLDEVTSAYVTARFPDFPAPGIKVDTARTRGRRAFARWTVAEAQAAGTLFLRQGDAGWDVIASTTDDIDLRDVRVEPGRVYGHARTSNINSMFADVLLLDGTPVPEAPRPEGYPGAEYRYATAAGPANRVLEIDVPIPPDAVLRVGLVGGTILAMSELRLS